MLPELVVFLVNAPLYRVATTIAIRSMNSVMNLNWLPVDVGLIKGIVLSYFKRVVGRPAVVPLYAAIDWTVNLLAVVVLSFVIVNIFGGLWVVLVGLRWRPRWS